MCVYVLFMWITCVHSTRRHDARVIDTDRGKTIFFEVHIFLFYSLKVNRYMTTVLCQMIQMLF